MSKISGTGLLLVFVILELEFVDSVLAFVIPLHSIYLPWGKNSTRSSESSRKFKKVEKSPHFLEKQ